MGKSQISYKVVSGGSALMETIREPNGTEMVTGFHPDGDRLLMTHYCSLGNQPRMRADGLSDGGKKVAFVTWTRATSPCPRRCTWPGWSSISAMPTTSRRPGR